MYASLKNIMPKDRDPSFAHIEVKALEHLFTVKKILLVPIELVLEARKCTRRRFVTMCSSSAMTFCAKKIPFGYVSAVI